MPVLWSNAEAPITGEALSRASAATLGRGVTGSEVGDEVGDAGNARSA